MKKITIILFILIIVCTSFIIFSLRNIYDVQYTTTSVPALTNKNEDMIAKATAYMEQECTRSLPEPVLNKKLFPNSTFNLEGYKVEDSNYIYLLRGIETLTLTSGDIVTITNSGCESYGLTFHFITSRFAAAPTDTAYWFPHSVDLMTQMKGAFIADVPLPMDTYIQKMASYVVYAKKNQYKDLKIGEYIPFRDDEVQETAVVDSIQKLADGTYAVDVSFSMGPI